MFEEKIIKVNCYYVIISIIIGCGYGFLISKIKFLQIKKDEKNEKKNY